MITLFIKWFMLYCLIILAMCIDNYFWIPADRKWYDTKEWRPYFKVLFIIRNREYIFPKTKEGWKIVKSRFFDVIKQPYDIIPGLIMSFILLLLMKGGFI